MNKILLSTLLASTLTLSATDPVNADAVKKILTEVASKNDPVIEMPSNSEVQKLGDYYGAKALGTLAYQWGYALLRMESAMRDYIDVPNPKPDTSYRAPLNQIGWATKLPMASDKDMPTANNDTFYMSAVLDLTEPYVLEIPDTQERYYVVNVFDMYQNLTNYIGTRTTGNQANTYLLVPPNWKGELPKKFKNVIHTSTQKVWLWGRLAVLEGENLAPVHKLQKAFTLKPLSAKGAKTSTTLPLMPALSKDDKLNFYKRLAFVMGENPIFAQDKALVGQFERIGLTAGKFDDSKLNDAQKRGLYDATLEAPLTVISSLQSSSQIVDGWTWVTKMDDFGYDYALRSMIAGPYLGGQGEKEALYPIRYTDDAGQVLNGKNSYTIHFDKEPPVNAFWSLTMYDATNKLFVDNELNRYKISRETKGLVKEKDGSFTITAQKKKPDSTDNWLPAPDGPFYMILRLYQPNDDILNLKYRLPPVTKQ